MSEENVFALHITSSGSQTTSKTFVRGYHIVPNGVTGSLNLTNGAQASLTNMWIDVPSTATDPLEVILPGYGIEFTSGIYATLNNLTKVTLFVSGGMVAGNGTQLAFYDKNNSDYLAFI